MGATETFAAILGTGDAQGSVVVEMGHFRNAKFQFETTGPVTLELRARLTNLGDTWPAPVKTGLFAPGATALWEIDSHYPQLLLSWFGNGGTVSVYVCLSEKMQN